MCFTPTKEDTARMEARRRAAPSPIERREDPSTDPEPRGNQEPDEREVEQSARELEAVLGH